MAPCLLLLMTGFAKLGVSVAPGLAQDVMVPPRSGACGAVGIAWGGTVAQAPLGRANPVLGRLHFFFGTRDCAPQGFKQIQHIEILMFFPIVLFIPYLFRFIYTIKYV